MMKIQNLTSCCRAFFVLLLLFICSFHAWGSDQYYYARINVKTVPTGSGTVYARPTAKSWYNNDGALPLSRTDRSSRDASFDLGIKPNQDCYLISWNDSLGTKLTVSNYSVNNDTISGRVTVKTSSTKHADEANVYNYYATIAKMTCNTTSLEFKPCGSSSMQTLVVTHANCGEISATITGDEGFSIYSGASISSPDIVGNSTASVANNEVVISYNPTTSGVHNATLTLTPTKTDYQGHSIPAKTISLSGDDCDPVITWKEPFTIKAGVPVPNIATTTSGQTVTVTIKSSDCGGSCSGSDFTPGNTEGTVTLQASVSAENGYKAATVEQTYTITSLTVRTIQWDQNFMLQYENDAPVTLNAKVLVDGIIDEGSSVTYSLSNVSPSGIVSLSDGNTKLNFGSLPNGSDLGTAKIKATTVNRNGYTNDSKELIIYVRRHTSCETKQTYAGGTINKTTSINITNQTNPFQNIKFDLTCVEESEATVYVNAFTSSNCTGTSEMIGGMTCYEGNKTGVSFPILNQNYHSYSITLVNTESDGTNSATISNIEMLQANYIEPEYSTINRTININTPTEISFKVRYSDQPALTFSNTLTDNIAITEPANGISDVNTCGTSGEITVKLMVTSSTVQTLTDILIISNGIDKNVQVSLNINAIVGENYYFVGTTDNDWMKAANWKVGNATTGATAVVLPTSANPVHICAPATLPAKRDVFSLTMETDGVLTIAPTGGLSVYNTISGATESNLILAAAKDYGTGYLRAPAGTTAPKATVQMYSRAYYDMTVEDPQANDAAFQYIGCPINAIATTAENLFYKCWLYKWNNAANDWSSVDNDYQMEPFRGYAFTQPNNADGMIISYAGSLYPFATKSVSIDRNSTEESDFMCVANSFAAPIDVTKFNSTDFVNLEQEIYVFNTGSFNDYKGIYDPEEGTGTQEDVLTPGQYITIPVSSVQSLGLPLVIPSMQGFFVKMLDGEISGSLNLDYNRLVWGGSGNNMEMRAPARERHNAPVAADELSARTIMMVSGANRSDFVCLLESDRFTKDYDKGYDGRKEMGSAANHQLYTNESAGQLMVSANNNLCGLMIGFRTPTMAKDTVFTYTVSFMNTIGSDYVLYDNVTKKETPVADGATYTFQMAANAVNDARFTIRRQSEIVTGWDDIFASESDIRMWTANDNLYVATPNEAANTLRIFDMQGHQIVEQSFRGTFISSLSMLPQGVYMATVGNQTLKFSK